MRLGLQFGASALSYRATEQAYTSFDNGTLLVDYHIVSVRRATPDAHPGLRRRLQDTGLLNGAIPIPGATSRVHEYFQFEDTLISRIDVYATIPA